MKSADLERLVDRRLKALPAPRAPRTLLPRVMAAVEILSSAPWYTRAWFAWPRVWQVASIAALVVLVAGVAAGWPHAEAVADALRPRPELSVPAQVTTMTRALDASWDATRIVWRVLVQPVIGYVVVFALMMFTACVAFGTALSRVALGGASEL